MTLLCVYYAIILAMTKRLTKTLQNSTPLISWLRFILVSDSRQFLKFIWIRLWQVPLFKRSWKIVVTPNDLVIDKNTPCLGPWTIIPVCCALQSSLLARLWRHMRPGVGVGISKIKQGNEHKSLDSISVPLSRGLSTPESCSTALQPARAACCVLSCLQDN